ncbi:MAG: hypothetical protein ABIN36_11680 [Ferruginibacter sp.]
MNNKTGYRATWDPGKQLKLGQIGKLDKAGVFSVYSSLEKEDIPMEIDVDTTTLDMDYTSNDSVTISTKLSGKAPVAGSVFTDLDAGFTFDFKSSKSIVFQSNGNKTNQIVNIAEVTKLILQKYKDGNWDKDWLVITELVEAGAATIIISNSSDGKLELKANANAGAGNLKLTDVSLGLSVARETGSTLKYIAENGLTPLYRVMGIRHPLFGKDSVVKKVTADKPVFEIQEFHEDEVK